MNSFKCNHKVTTFDTIEQAKSSIQHRLILQAVADCEQYIRTPYSKYSEQFIVGDMLCTGKLHVEYGSDNHKFYVKEASVKIVKITKNTPHIDADALRAFACGITIQRFIGNNMWQDDSEPYFHPLYRFRIKPHKWQVQIDAQEDGQTIQYRLITEIDHPVWIDGPTHLHIQDDAYEYRVKPNTVRFRVALLTNTPIHTTTMSVNSAEHEELLLTSKQFVKWLSDWQEVEV